MMHLCCRFLSFLISQALNITVTQSRLCHQLKWCSISKLTLTCSCVAIQWLLFRWSAQRVSVVQTLLDVCSCLFGTTTGSQRYATHNGMHFCQLNNEVNNAGLFAQQRRITMTMCWTVILIVSSQTACQVHKERYRWAGQVQDKCQVASTGSMLCLHLSLAEF